MYKETVTTLQQTVNEAGTAADALQALVLKLEMIQSMDPDIAMDASSGTEPEQHQQPAAAAAAAHIRDVLRRAVETCDAFGRSSGEAELAWMRVAAACSDRDDISILTHPSYRYNYAYHLLHHHPQNELQPRWQRRRNQKGSSPTEHTLRLAQQLNLSSARALQALQQLHGLLDAEQRRLQQREQQRSEYVSRLLENL
jgi:hypothetical protein